MKASQQKVLRLAALAALVGVVVVAAVSACVVQPGSSQPTTPPPAATTPVAEGEPATPGENPSVPVAEEPAPTPPAQPAPAPATPVEPPAKNTCIARTGCPAAKQPIETCAGRMAARPFGEIFAGAKGLVGKEVIVAASLAKGPTRCTRMFCGEGSCCNRCSANAVLVDDPDAPKKVTGTIALNDPAAANRFACPGDDSAVCCSVPADGQDRRRPRHAARRGRSIRPRPAYALHPVGLRRSRAR